MFPAFVVGQIYRDNSKPSSRLLACGHWWLSEREQLARLPGLSGWTGQANWLPVDHITPKHFAGELAETWVACFDNFPRPHNASTFWAIPVLGLLELPQRQGLLCSHWAHARIMRIVNCVCWTWRHFSQASLQSRVEATLFWLNYFLFLASTWGSD